MVRLTACLGCLFAIPALASAQGVVVVGYAPPVYVAPPAPVVTTYYAPAPVATSYYAAPAPVANSYYAAPTVSYYAAPAVSYYTAPAVSYYAAPAVTTYRYPIFRPRTTVVRTYPAGPVVAAYYPPSIYVR